MLLKVKSRIYDYQWGKIESHENKLPSYNEKTDYLRFIIYKCDQTIIGFRHDMCRDSVCRKPESQCVPGNGGIPCSYIRRCMFVRDMAENNFNYYCSEIAAGKKSPSDPPRAIARAIFKGYRRELLYWIRGLIKNESIANATDAQICALFYCTMETDNADYEIDNPVVLVWLLPGNSFAFMLNEMKPLDCFDNFHYFEQFKRIIVGRDLQPLCDLSAKKTNANSESDKNMQILSHINNFRKFRTMNNEK